jgi:hypothetical protein
MKFLRALGIFGAALVFVLAAVFLSSKIEKTDNNDEVENQTAQEKITCPNDFASFASTTKKVSLIENKPSNGAKGVAKGYKVTLKRTGLTSDIACGYLSYKISFAGRPIEQDYMSLSMKPTGSQFGGHIIPDEKRGALIGEVDSKTEVLMPLDTITFDGLERNPIKEVNWAALLNVTEQIEFEIALSADTPLGNLDSVEMGYKCINKETRRATEDCNLEVVSVVPFGF